MSSCLLFDAEQASEGLGSGDRYVARLVAELGHPGYRRYQQDRPPAHPRRVRLPIVEAVSKLGDWNEMFQISAAEGTNVEPLMDSIVDLLPPGPRYFPKEQ